MSLPTSFFSYTLEQLRQELSVFASSLVGYLTREHTATGLHTWSGTTIAYNARYFSGEVSTWGVDNDDVKTYRYAVLGDMLQLAFRIETSDVGASNGYLKVALPTGYVIAGRAHGTMNYSDAGAAPDLGIVEAWVGERHVRCYTRTAAVWTSTTGDNTLVQGTILMPVTKE